MGEWVKIANAKLNNIESRKRKQVQVYLAGPMRNYEEFNFPAFHEATVKLRAKGYIVHSPAEEEMNAGFNPKTGLYPEGQHQRTIRENLRDDLSWICEYADLIVLLPGWERSKGATAEVYCAHSIGVEVTTLEKALSREMADV